MFKAAFYVMCVISLGCKIMLSVVREMWSICDTNEAAGIERIALKRDSGDWVGKIKSFCLPAFYIHTHTCTQFLFPSFFLSLYIYGHEEVEQFY